VQELLALLVDKLGDKQVASKASYLLIKLGERPY
jgi:hypothetical protein